MSITKVYVPAMLCIQVPSNTSNAQIEKLTNNMLTDNMPAIDGIKTINGVDVNTASLWIPNGDDIQIYR